MSPVRLACLVVCLVAAVTVHPYAQQKPAAPAAAKAAAGPVLLVDTAKGAFEIEMYAADAPKSVERILQLAKSGFYRGLRVHWAQGAVVQFGDPTSRNVQRMADWGSSGSGKRIGVAEISKKTFERGTVGYAYRTDQKAEDADSQMFILKNPSPNMNGKYVALGKVVKGMDVVDKLGVSDVIKNVTLKP